MGGTFNMKGVLRQCPIHHIPYDGVCGEKSCVYGLICLKCNPKACTQTQKHVLITIDEFYHNFFKNLPNLIDFKQLKKFLETGLIVQKKQLNLQYENFEKWEMNLINNKFESFKERINKKIENFKNKIMEKLTKLNEQLIESNSRYELSGSEEFENINLEETTKSIEKNKNNQKELEKIIALIKKYSDNEKLLTKQKDLENIIYTKTLYDSMQSKSFSVQEKITSFSNKLDSDGKIILSNIFIKKPENGLFSIEGKRFKTNPSTLKFKIDLSTKAQKSFTIDNVIAVYVGYDGNSYLAAPISTTFEIEIMNLRDNKIVHSLKGHSAHIYIVRHYFQRKSSTDFLISTSSERKVKVWNLKTYECHITLNKCHTGTYLYSVLLLFDNINNLNYIVTSCPNEYMKLWDFDSGKFIREIGSISDYTYFINYWNNNNINYIINANSSNVKIYGINKSKEIYREFLAPQSTWHMSAFVERMNDINYLFESDGNGYLRIWNIEKKEIYKSIQASGCNLRGICFWNDRFIIAASSDKGFKIFDLENNKNIITIHGHESVLCTVQKIMHPLYGESLISSGIDGNIKLWIQKNN
jgi:hypothetical protein